MRSEITLGKLKIFLPDENSSQFYIFEDIAGFLGEEYQSDAVRKLRKEIKKANLKPNPAIDYEGSNASIRTSNAEAIVQVLKILDAISIPEYKFGITDRQWQELSNSLRTWKRPKPQKWRLGDIFYFELNNGEYTFGQVVGKWPTVALFEFKSKTHEINLNQLKKQGIITILHVGTEKLNDNSWKVIANYELLANKDEGPNGSDVIRIGHTSDSARFINSIANYYWFKTHNLASEHYLTDVIMIK
jgi:Immunity protein 26